MHQKSALQTDSSPALRPKPVLNITVAMFITSVYNQSKKKNLISGHLILDRGTADAPATWHSEPEHPFLVAACQGLSYQAPFFAPAYRARNVWTFARQALPQARSLGRSRVSSVGAVGPEPSLELRNSLPGRSSVHSGLQQEMFVCFLGGTLPEEAPVALELTT